MHDWEQGVVKIADDLCVYPGYTFDDFKKTKYYNGQDGALIVSLNEVFLMENHKFKVGLFFMKYRLYALFLGCCDIDIPRIDVKRRRALHNSILEEKNIKRTDYTWGKLLSEYDPIGDTCDISFYYK